MEIGLAEALRALRDELAAAALEAAGQPVRLHVETINLDLQVAVTNSVEAGGGVRFWVLSADTKAARNTAVTHTVSLQLKAETATGGRVRTSSDEGERLPLPEA
ncbi:trypco2 family protein [Streptomyces sp. NPDC057302]|uniref:trypco2 family protein n=1 Tax=Streptomyces sp. NPDC057302 TaxID=3346094 RepID=UPI00363C58D3